MSAVCGLCGAPNVEGERCECLATVAREAFSAARTAGGNREACARAAVAAVLSRVGLAPDAYPVPELATSTLAMVRINAAKVLDDPMPPQGFKAFAGHVLFLVSAPRRRQLFCMFCKIILDGERGAVHTLLMSTTELETVAVGNVSMVVRRSEWVRTAGVPRCTVQLRPATRSEWAVTLTVTEWRGELKYSSQGRAPAPAITAALAHFGFADAQAVLPTCRSARPGRLRAPGLAALEALGWHPAPRRQP